MFLPEEFAQVQTALYEQFLASLQAFTLSLEASGTVVSAKVLRESEERFVKSYSDFDMFFLAGVRDFNNQTGYDFSVVSQEIYDRYVGNVEKEMSDWLRQCMFSNRSTFLSAVKFGGAFEGLSNLLQNMHGYMGYLVQKKARQIQWNTRGSDGRKLSCEKGVYLHARHFAYRMIILDAIMQEAKSGRVIEIVDENYEVIEICDPDELLNSDDLCNRYFHFNSRNYIKRNYAVQS